MRSSRFLMLMSVSLAVLLCLAGSGAGQEVVDVYSFTGTGSSGYPNYVMPVQGRNGLLWGCTGGPSGTDGSVFEIGVAGHPFVSYVPFIGSNGANPFSGLTLGSDGNFYGTAYAGGSSGYGVMFKIGSDGTYTVLHEFLGGSDGAGPSAPPFLASDGNWYGTTLGQSPNYYSTIYKYAASGEFSTIFQFDGTDGAFVLAPPVQGSDGSLYGTADGGGKHDSGALFKVSTSGTLLWSYRFGGGPTAGSSPIGGLVQAADGNFYGTLQERGSYGYGAIYKLDPTTDAVSIIHNFSGNDGQNPNSGLTQGTDGNLYGTAAAGGRLPNGTYGYGTAFQMTTGGTFTLLYIFDSPTGKYPLGALTQHTSGRFYGTAYQGGAEGYGTVFSLDMGLGPFVTVVQPTAAVGGTAQILGQGLTGTTSVTFNGIAATSFKVVTDTYMTAVVPTGATTGKLVVTTPSGPLTSNVNFRIIQ